MPKVTLSPRPGRFLWTCRPGFEAHLFEELAWEKCSPRLLGPALVEADAQPEVKPAFGRTGFEVTAVLEVPISDGALQKIAKELRLRSRGKPLVVQAWAPDADGYRGLTETAEKLGLRLREALGEIAAKEGGPPSALLGQLCILDRERAAAGWVMSRDAVSLSAGGRHRMRRDREAPSRAAMKLEEALESLGYGPERGDRCADLGAAPGGWTQRLVERGAKVIAVDPGPLRPDIARHPKVKHLRESAFRYEPDEPLDWLFCDMAWRPLEVAQLLAKWGRNGWADALCANIKLPMKDKNPILFRIRALLAEAGWRRLRLRQLYHDRDEVTVTAGLR